MKKMLMALSLTGALLGGSAVVWAEEAVSTPVVEQTVAASDAAITSETVVATEAPVAEEAAAPAAVATVDTGDTAWILVSTALVLLMTIPGLTHRIVRKILSHTISVILNIKLGNPPLQLEILIKS